MWPKSGKCCLPAGRVSLRGSRPEMSGCLGKRWMTAAQRKWFRSLFQILNQPSLRATTADINCDTCDFLLPAQIMIVWTTGALAPSPLRHRKRNWLWAQISQWAVTGLTISQAELSTWPSYWFNALLINIFIQTMDQITCEVVLSYQWTLQSPSAPLNTLESFSSSFKALTNPLYATGSAPNSPNPQKQRRDSNVMHTGPKRLFLMSSHFQGTLCKMVDTFYGAPQPCERTRFTIRIWSIWSQNLWKVQKTRRIKSFYKLAEGWTRR